jgi:hypothetical protein
MWQKQGGGELIDDVVSITHHLCAFALQRDEQNALD